MPRGFRAARKPKEPAAPVVYEVSPEIETVMHRLIRLNPVQFGWVNNFKLGCVIVRGAKAKDEGGCVILARFVKVPPLWHGLTGYDAIIRVEDWAWRRLAAEQQEALVTHVLCHGSMSDKGALRVVKHDLEEFGFVVRKYGAWQEGIALFDKQLSMFEPGLGTATTGAQIAVGESPVQEATRLVGDIVTKIVGDALDETDLRPTGEVNPAALRGEAERSSEPTPLRPRRTNHGQPPAPLA